MNEQQVTIIYHISPMSVPSQHCLFSAASTASAGGLQQLLIRLMLTQLPLMLLMASHLFSSSFMLVCPARVTFPTLSGLQVKQLGFLHSERESAFPFIRSSDLPDIYKNLLKLSSLSVLRVIVGVILRVEMASHAKCQTSDS